MTHSIMHYFIQNSWRPKYRSGHPAGHPKLLQLETPLYGIHKLTVKGTLGLFIAVLSP